MTVAELITELEKHDKVTPVKFNGSSVESYFDITSVRVKEDLPSGFFIALD